MPIDLSSGPALCHPCAGLPGRLEGHGGPVLAACFAEHAPHVLATAGEDRTFKVRAALHAVQCSVLCAVTCRAGRRPLNMSKLHPH